MCKISQIEMTMKELITWNSHFGKNEKFGNFVMLEYVEVLVPFKL